MATVNFYLDKANKSGKSPIMMTYLADGQKFRHSVKIKVSANQWLTKRLASNQKTNDALKELGELAGLTKWYIL